MPRIRSVHPELHADDDFLSVSPLARLLFIALHNWADDQGVFEWKSGPIRRNCQPEESEADVVSQLAELERRRLVQRFDSEGRAYGAIRDFWTTQRPKKPGAVYPLPKALVTFVQGPRPRPGSPQAELALDESDSAGGRQVPASAPGARVVPEGSQTPAASPPVAVSVPYLGRTGRVPKPAEVVEIAPVAQPSATGSPPLPLGEESEEERSGEELEGEGSDARARPREAEPSVGGTAAGGLSTAESRAGDTGPEGAPTPHRIPASWQPSETTREWTVTELLQATSCGLTTAFAWIEATRARFEYHFVSTGTELADWDARWRLWVAEDLAAGRGPRKPPPDDPGSKPRLYRAPTPEERCALDRLGFEKDAGITDAASRLLLFAVAQPWSRGDQRAWFIAQRREQSLKARGAA